MTSIIYSETRLRSYNITMIYSVGTPIHFPNKEI